MSGALNRYTAPAATGPGFFESDPHYQQTRLLHDLSRPQMYLTLDIWQSKESYELFKSQNQEAYSGLNKTCEAFTVSERFLGSFEQPVEGH